MNGKEKDIKSDLKRLDAMTDDDIDYSDIPELDDNFWANAEIFIGGKKAISMRVDEDILAFFKSRGKGYQTAMNKVLRQYMEAQMQIMSKVNRSNNRIIDTTGDQFGKPRPVE